MLKFRNNAEAVLADAMTDDSGAPGYGTILVVDDGSAEAFAGEGPQLATLMNATMPGLFEVVKIISRTGAEFTVERGLEGPSDAAAVQAWPAGTSLSARVTASMLESFFQVDKGFFAAPAEGAERFAAIGYPTIKRHSTQMLSSPTVYHRGGTAMPAAGASMYVDLGVPPPWSAGNFIHGDVVAPTTPDGCQYWACTNSEGSVSIGAEPAFAGSGTGALIDPSDVSKGYMIAMDTPIEFNVRFEGVHLVVEEVGFIARTVNAGDVPLVSIGSDLDFGSPNPTRFANNVALSQITGDNSIHRIPIAAGGQLVDTLTFKVETSATGGQFAGRFYWRGFFVEPG